MTSETAKPGPGHECESWQIRRDADGARYCAACGERVTYSWAVDADELHAKVQASFPDVRPARDGEPEVLQSVTARPFPADCPGTCPGDEPWCCLDVNA